MPPQNPSASEIGAAIRAAREALGLSQPELAEAVGLPAPQTVSDIELGKREVKARELVRFARVLHRSVEALLGTAETSSSMKVLWRRASPAENRSREAQLVERARRYFQLEEWCNDHAPLELPDLQIDPASASPKRVAQMADDQRKTLDLGSFPAASLLQTLEDTYGVKVFYEDLSQADDGDSSAACVRGDFGCAILMDSSEAPWRRNFNLAHELFHLITWSSIRSAWERDKGPAGEPEWFESIERLANVFAGNLLLPAESLTTHFSARIEDNEIDYADLIQLAREFGVSTHALLVRLKILGRISQAEMDRVLGDEAFRDADRASMVDYWEEPVSARPFTDRYRNLAVRAYREGVIGVSRLAEYLEVEVGEVAGLPQDLMNAKEASVTVA